MDSNEVTNKVYKSDTKLRVLCIIAIFLSIISIIFTYKTSVSSNNNQYGLSWSVAQNGSEVDVYLNGKNASNVTGADINVFFDKTSLMPQTVVPGEFFSQPIVVRLNSSTLVYSLVGNPSNNTVDSTKPILKFQFTGTKAAGFKFYVLPSSEVYISHVGGANPEPSAIVLN